MSPNPNQPTPKDPWPDEERPQRSVESLAVYKKRYDEARKAGLTLAEAQMFADSPADIGHLRAMVRGGCSPRFIVDMLLL
jgi:hypothetical protein